MREIQKTYYEDFEIRSFENDFNQNLRLTTLFQFFQEVAGRHVAQTPIGYESLKEVGCFWVLVRIKVKIHRMPKWRETIRLTTWAKKMDKMFAYRECEATNETGLLASISSEWMLMGEENRKPQRLSTLPISFPIYEKESLNESLNKIKPFGELNHQRSIKARYSDIDMHSHVNNTKYIEWALDSFEFQAFKDREIDYLQINFIAEVSPDDDIHLSRYDEEDGHYFFSGYNKTKNIKAFQLELKMR